LNVNKEELFGSDLKLRNTTEGVDLSIDSERGDIVLVSGEMNLSQAIQHRLKTGIGELTEIGYPKYGSNIYDLIGETNNELTRTRLVSVIRNILTQEPRIKEIRKIIVRGPSSMESDQASLFKNIAVNNGRIIDFREQGIEEGENFQAVNSTPSPYIVEVQIFIVPIGTKDIVNIEFTFSLDVT
jgi:phage baseplate assembly protein W